MGRPGGLKALSGGALCVAVACVAQAALFAGAGGTTLAWLALPALAAGLLHLTGSSPSPVSALRPSTGAGPWQVRLSRRWRDAVLLEQHAGPAWLTLTMRVLPAGSAAFETTIVTFTVWRHALRPEAWRRLRLRLLAAASRRHAPAVRLREAS